MRRESADVRTLELEAEDARPLPPFRAGQFHMLYAFGVGEAPISTSGHPDTGSLSFTVRAVGAVTRALCALRKGDVVGVRGPFGVGWPLAEARGGDVVLVAGGIGVAPLRAALFALAADRRAYGQVRLIYGARSPSQLLFARELERLSARSGVEVDVTVDTATEGWRGRVGVVTPLVARATVAPDVTTALLCGPEVMIGFAARALEAAGLPAARVYVSLERHMKCAIGLCGRCQLLPFFVCKDGPVFSYPDVRRLLAVSEL